MAKRKSRKRRRKLGSTIRVRKLNGIGAITKSNSLMGAALPTLLGGGAAAITTIGIRQFDTAPPMLVQYSPWAGLAASSVIAGVLYKMQSQAAGVGAFAGGLAVTLATVLMEWLAKEQLLSAGASGLAAIVPEFAGTSGVGALSLEPLSSRGYGATALGKGVGSYGEVVNLNGINPSVIGFQQFQA